MMTDWLLHKPKNKNTNSDPCQLNTSCVINRVFGMKVDRLDYNPYN